MTDPTGPVVVVGASAAGPSAAEGLRRGDYTAAGPLDTAGTTPAVTIGTGSV